MLGDKEEIQQRLRVRRKGNFEVLRKAYTVSMSLKAAQNLVVKVV